MYGDAIMPGGRYDVQAITEGCDLANDCIYSEALPVATFDVWGDVVSPFTGPGSPPQPDFLDVSSVVDKFGDLDGAIIRARADVHPDTPDQVVDFQDISKVVDGFKGEGYPFDGPSGCR